MEESSTEDMPDIIIPPVEVNMVVEEETVALQNGDNITSETTSNDYKKEMLQNGLESSDLEYFTNAYKNLDDVKFIRIHCTSCDKHVGSAPNSIQNRYEHPLLKVLICGHCFQFYSSGDFEKDEDGSELYCRWCGEGGQVFCCTKCPFVFCKKCIRRNLGRGIAKTIENSDNWMCFSCDTSQISRHRATYWAVQKYSDEMIKKSKITGNTDILSVDENICCSTVKKRSEVYNKLLQPPKKKQKLMPVSALQLALEKIQPSSSKQKKYQNKVQWQPPFISQQPEDEVICTPDIIPMDESPPRSPERVASPAPSAPPLIPLIQHNIPVAMPVPPLIMRPPVPTNMCITDLQRHLQQKYTQIILTPRPQMKPPVINNQAVLIRKQTPLMPKTAPQSNGNYRFVINATPSTSVANVVNTNYVIGPINRIKKTVQNPVNTALNAPVKSKDWFDQAVVDCAEVTEYISTKISSLSGVHTRAYKSEKLMEELHKTFQTYMHVTMEKINKIRSVMQSNFEKDMMNHFKTQKIVNPFAIKNNKKPDNTSEEISTSEDSNSSHSFKNSKTRFVLTKNIKPDEVLFDMDVTNASDEENQSTRNSARTTPLNDEFIKDEDDSDDDVQEVEYKRNTEVIHIIDSDDDEIKEDNTVPEIMSEDVLEKIRAKFNIVNIPSKELIKYLSAVVIVTNKINKEIEELSNSKILVIAGDIQRNIETKLMTGIQKLLEDSIIEGTDNKESVVNNAVEIENSEKDSELTCEKNVHDDKNMCNDNEKVLCDIEDILSSNVVIRANKSGTSFVDEFSKFVCGKVEESLAEGEEFSVEAEESPVEAEESPIEAKETVAEAEKTAAEEEKNAAEVEKTAAEAKKAAVEAEKTATEADVSDDMSESLKDTINIARELDIIPEYVNDICNRDNGSLSLPPDSITEFSAKEMEMLMKENVEDEVESDVINKENNSDIVLNSEILALKQMAENCVNSVDHKTSTECKG